MSSNVICDTDLAIITKLKLILWWRDLRKEWWKDIWCKTGLIEKYYDQPYTWSTKKLVFQNGTLTLCKKLQLFSNTTCYCSMSVRHTWLTNHTCNGKANLAGVQNVSVCPWSLTSIINFTRCTIQSPFKSMQSYI